MKLHQGDIIRYGLPYLEPEIVISEPEMNFDYGAEYFRSCLNSNGKTVGFGEEKKAEILCTSFRKRPI